MSKVTELAKRKGISYLQALQQIAGVIPPTSRADSVACSELVGVSLSDGAKEALRWLWKCDQLQTVRDAREYIEWHWGLEVSAELKAAFSDSPTVRGVPRS